MSQFTETASYVSKRVVSKLLHTETEADKLGRASIMVSGFMLAAAGLLSIAKPLAGMVAPTVKDALQAQGYLLDKHPELEKRHREQQQAPAPM